MKKKIIRKGTKINVTCEEYNEEIVKAIRLFKKQLRQKKWTEDKIEKHLPYLGQRIGRDLFTKQPKGPMPITESYLQILK